MQRLDGHVGNNMGVKLCPMCRGRQTNNVFARIISGPCDYCGGQGKLETNRMCECGRPAVKRTNEIWHCARLQCGEQALKGQKNV